MYQVLEDDVEKVDTYINNRIKNVINSYRLQFFTLFNEDNRNKT